MNVVLYTKDFEPITVIDLPLWLLDEMEKRGGARLAIQEPLNPNAINDPSIAFTPKICTLYAEKLRWKDGSMKTIVMTPDEELAMLLKPDWLPGQRGTFNQYRDRVKSLTNMLIQVMRRTDPY